MTGRRTSTSGFTLAETCLAILILSLFMAFCLPVHELNLDDYYSFADSHILVQSEALACACEMSYESENAGVVTFNENGKADPVQTVFFPHRNKEIVIELGGGRLVFK